MEDHNHNHKLIIILLSAILLMTVFISTMIWEGREQKTHENIQQAMEQNEEISEIEEVVGDWVRYENEELGFSVSIPREFAIFNEEISSSGGSVIFGNPEDFFGSGYDGELFMSIVKEDEVGTKIFESYIPKYTNAPEPKNVKIDGFDAQIYEQNISGNYKTVKVLIDAQDLKLVFIIHIGDSPRIDSLEEAEYLYNSFRKK
ncbi:MAG: hypothetical protein ACI9AR_000015 [Flavobacteriaceae bacterium]|jgi:hypothetical protein